MEQDFFVGYHNFAGKQRTLAVFWKNFRGQTFPPSPLSSYIFKPSIGAMSAPVPSAPSLPGFTDFLSFFRNEGRFLFPFSPWMIWKPLSSPSRIGV
jgi:hypothetical protein